MVQCFELFWRRFEGLIITQLKCSLDDKWNVYFADYQFQVRNQPFVKRLFCKFFYDCFIACQNGIKFLKQSFRFLIVVIILNVFFRNFI